MFERAARFAQSLPRPSRVIGSHLLLVTALIGYGVALGASGLALGYAVVLLAGLAFAAKGRTGLLFALDFIVFLVAAIPAALGVGFAVWLLAAGGLGALNVGFGAMSVALIVAMGLPAALSVVGLRALRDQERGGLRRP